MTDIQHMFNEAHALTENDVAASILVLAQVIKDKKTIDVASGENFGHELAIALRETHLHVSLEGRVETDAV